MGFGPKGRPATNRRATAVRPRRLLTGLLALLLVPSGAVAQGTGTVHRLGLLAGSSAAATAFVRAAVVTGLDELGYHEGREVMLVERYADGQFERLPELAAELIRLRVDVLLTSTTPATVAAKQATSSIPIVVVTGGDLVGTGIVTSLAHPGGNVTGLSFLGTELAVKQMDLLKQIAPAIRSVGFLGNRSVSPEVLFFQEMERAAPELSVRVRFLDARGASDYDAAFATLARDRLNGLVVAPNLTNLDHRQAIVDRVVRAAVPAVYPSQEFVEAGGLISYGINRPQFFRRAAGFVDRILRGARPADLPIEQPTTFELVINRRTARALGLAIPPALLARADHVIE